MINMPNFGVILDMDFLNKYGVKIDYRKKKIWFSLDNREQFTFG